MSSKLSRFSFILLTLMLTSCVVRKPDSQEMKNDLSSLEDFNKSQSVLLIDKINSGMYKGIYNKRRMNDCEKYFNGKVEATPLENVDKDPKYNDKKIYRYILKETETTQDFNYTNSRTGASKTNTHVTTNYVLVDRQTGKEINLNIYGPNPDRVFKKAVQKVNTFLKP
jgi:hypothetical protein